MHRVGAWSGCDPLPTPGNMLPAPGSPPPPTPSPLKRARIKDALLCLGDDLRGELRELEEGEARRQRRARLVRVATVEQAVEVRRRCRSKGKSRLSILAEAEAVGGGAAEGEAAV